MSGRSEILERIRRATGSSPATVPVPRDYDRAGSDGPADVARFAAAVDDYRAQVFRIKRKEIATTVRSLLAADARIVIPSDLPAEWLPAVDVLIDNNLPVSLLDEVDAVVTGCAVGIAATGTIVLDAGVAQGRRVLTLVPDHHICIVFADQLVETVPQAFMVLDPRRPLTFISGPSATSDIELNRVEGVHGPRVLDVLIVE
ncbi:LutC/YkgG family protein [Nocardia australiensis]|uniref:LutC/YkgG family protein n=1 Tax=Nocardia australiensis TaxID=2887191 RepID=UPI001D1477F1|nr:LUD domain-containing protein [Nocardia australiensis]